ncbi:MAG: RNA polymerase factor sigma-54 [Deltaproteobacteria bacterium]|nr:RNA polymerase factor sigma-54 [Deltaproteobacteria bacterium]MBW2118748.1 RNA polymerase factor sigma-54 [Deltaproteobacteria bacterium]MBW2342780.1 RNA polymerase factor sigma-54 [Deltaproteobacteria bacterium]
MALELRQSLGLAQQLIMTPQLQQAIKLLQLSRLELVETLYEEMETNPLLEEQVPDEAEEDKTTEDVGDEPAQESQDPPEVTVEEHARDDVDWENYLSEYNTGWAESPVKGKEAPSFENITATKPNLSSHLMWQLSVSNLDEKQREIGIHVIGNLDDDGYLDISLKEISEITGHAVEKVLETLRLIQNFDPVGVAARDTRETLLVQARFHDLGGTIVEKIIMDHLGDLENKKYDQVAKDLSVTLQEVLTAVSVIQGLEPKPGRTYSNEETIYITPDIYVFKVGDDYEIVLNEDGLPKLRINGYYRDIMRNRDSVSEKARTYIQEKLKSAAWLIKSIHQRQRTIYRVTESIIRFQGGFLANGITGLKPLVLRNVAEDIQMHESTVSRVTTNKYIQTPQGLFELKFFFNSSISSVYGDDVASESVKEYVRNIIKSENKVKPFSDQGIADILKKLNIKVARRTIAKYRESMDILPSRKRKNLY